MPLYPPPQLVEHPADLVIDVFGTFLGKRSERMIVRWREFDQPPVTIPLPSSDAELGARNSELETLADGTTLERSSPGGDVPEEATGTENEDTLKRELQLGSAAISPAPSSELRAPSSLAPQPSPLSPTPAELTSQLIDAIAEHNPPRETPLPSKLVRLQEQLNEIADRDGSSTSSAIWRERAVPMSRLRSVTVSGRGVTISSDLIAALVERGITLSFLSGRGQPVAQLSAPGLSGTVLTRRSQLAAYETARGVEIAVEFIRGKLRNQLNQLQYSGKYLKSADPPRFDRLVKKVKALSALRKQLKDFHAENMDAIRDKLMGYEGTGARLYWEGVAIILEGRIDFPGRATRGALDPVNSALNYGYGILYGQVSAAIVNAGLELFAGFLHVDRAGKPAMVLDLVEEFRAPIVDRVILAIVNQGIEIETDAHGLTGATRKLVAHRVLERLSTPVPYEGKRWPLRTIIQNQARHLAVAVRGEREYRAFASRW